MKEKLLIPKCFCINKISFPFLSFTFDTFFSNRTMETNKEKGDKYEVQTRNHIINVENKRAYLWHHAPETLLIKNGIIGSHNIHRLKRKDNKLNSLLDTGIDIIIDNNENVDEYDIPCSIVQCKNGYKGGITMEHLSGFMHWFGLLEHLSGHVYYTSKLSIHIRELPKSDRLTYIKLPYKNTKLSNNVVDLVIIEPYHYQIDASIAFSNFHRGILSLPCGTGKTMISYIISKKYKQVIIISPLRQFAKQNLDRFLEYGYKDKVLLVDSDGERDTDKIVEFIVKNPSFLLSCTFKSVDVIWKIMDHLGENDDVLFIVDEFHNLSVTNISDENDNFYKILNSDKRILFMSATPRVYELEEKNIDYYCSENIFGEILYKMSFNEAIEKKYITDYRIWLPSISENLDDLLQELTIYEIDNVIKSKCMYFFSCLLKNGSRKCIIYGIDNSEINSMMMAMDCLNDHYCMDFEMDKINAFNNAESRQRILDKFQYKNDKIQLLFSIRILDECIDVPACDSIFITYPSQSKIRTIQRLSRCIRTDKMNRFKVGNIFIWCNQYDDILSTLSGLKEYDSVFRDKIKVSAMDFYEKSERNMLVIKDIESMKEYLIGAKEFKCVSWKEKLDLLEKFLEKYGKRPSTIAKDGNEKSLGNWIGTQLKNRVKSKDIMASVEICDVWDAFKNKYIEYLRSNEEIWYEKLEKAKLFFETNKKRPSHRAKDKNEKVLATWISHQSTNRPNNQKIMASVEICDVWDAFKNKYIEYFRSNEETWYEKLEAVKSFFETNKKRPSDSGKDKNEKVLGKWISHQLKNRPNNQYSMASAKICDVWDAFKNKYIDYLRSNEEIWYEKLEAVKLFFETNGKRPSTTAKDKKEKELATWIRTQLRNRLKNQYIMVSAEICDVWDAFICTI